MKGYKLFQFSLVWLGEWKSERIKNVGMIVSVRIENVLDISSCREDQKVKG